MMTDDSIRQKQLAFIVPASIYSLWQCCAGWLNTYWTVEKLGNSYTTFNYVMFFFIHAAGAAAFSFILEKQSANAGLLKKLSWISAAVSAFLFAVLPYADGLMFILSFYLSALLTGFIVAFLSMYIYRNIPSGKRGMTVAISTSLSIITHFLFYTLIWPHENGPMLYVKTWFAAAMLALLGVVPLFLPVCRKYLWSDITHVIETGTVEKPFHPRLLPLLLIILICFFISFGVQDFAATAYWLKGVSSLAYTRVFLIAGFIAGGLLWNKNIRSLMLPVSFTLLLLGFVSMAFQYEGIVSFICYSAVQVASAFFALYIRLISLDIAKFYKRPVLVCTLGIALPMVLKQAGIIAAGITYVLFGGMAVFVISLLFIACAFPFFSMFFEKLRDVNVATIQRDLPLTGMADAVMTETEVSCTTFTENKLELLCSKYNFTKRERQILELSMRGMTIADMAENLNLSQSTIKHYVRQILAKTDTKNQRQLHLLIMNQSCQESPDKS